MDLFGSTGGSAWRTQSPGQWMLDSAHAAEGIGRSFGAAFGQASQQKQQQGQFDKKMTEDKRQFDATLAQNRDKFIEGKREWEILHPDPMKPWNAPSTTPPPAETPRPSYDEQFQMPTVPPAPTFGMAYAEGGRPPVGEPAIVGERGPEVFVPDTAGTVIPNDEIGMRYDRNGTGAFTPTTAERKPAWMTAVPVQSWRATNALDAVGKVTQAQTFSDLTKIQAENPEAGMYPQFQNALAQKSMVLQRGDSIALRQKQVENTSVEAKSRLDLNKRFNDRFTALPDSFQVAVRALGDSAKNPDGTPSPAAMHVLQTGEEFKAAQIAEKAKAAELVATKIDPSGKTTYGVRKAADVVNTQPMTKVLDNGVTLAWMPGSKGLHQIRPNGEQLPATAAQAGQFAKFLTEAGDKEATNFVNMAKEKFKEQFNAPAKAAAGKAPAAQFDFVPGKGLVPIKR